MMRGQASGRDDGGLGARDAADLNDSQVAREVLRRLRNVRGHISGIERMIEDGADCKQVLDQLVAIKAAIDRAGYKLVEYYALKCVSDDQRNPKEAVSDVLSAAVRFFR